MKEKGMYGRQTAPFFTAIRTALVVLSCLGFGALYFHELNPYHEWPPVHYRVIINLAGPFTLIVLNVIFVLGIALSMTGGQIKRERMLAQGVFVAFLISLLSEMFGVPLSAFLLASRLPEIGEDYLRRFGHGPITFGFALVLIGMAIILTSWITLYYSRSSLVVSGPYQFIRHPQYLGFIIFVTGWIIHWPTILALLLYPACILMYIYAALREDRWMSSRFVEYAEYKERTGLLLPKILSLTGSGRIH